MLTAQKFALDHVPASLADVIITPQILQRPAKAPCEATDKVFRLIDEQVQLNCDHVLQLICEQARKLTQANAAGISCVDYRSDVALLDWHASAGSLASTKKVCTPRKGTPCGTALDYYSYQLFQHPERHYEWLHKNRIVIPEMLVMPLYKQDHTDLGTIWLAHEEGRHFDREDVRILTVLGVYVKSVISAQQKRADMLTDEV